MKKVLFLSLLSISLAIPLIVANNKKSEPVEATMPEYNIPLEAGEEFDYENQYIDTFDNGINSDKWYLNNKVWGQVNGRKNGGVVPDNVFYDSTEGTAILRATGDQYAEKGITQKDAAESRGGRRTGADLVSKFWTYPGRYEVRMKVAPRYGACTSLWTYIEYAATNNNGDHHNHEIDIELPWHGDFNQISYGNYSSLSQHTSYKYFTPSPMNDGEYHTFGFDWYYNNNTGNKKIVYYYDGETYTIDTNIPFYKTKVNIGVWIPNSELAGQIPAFDKAYVDIDYFKYIPFKNNLHQDSDYPSTYVISEANVASLDQYPSTSTPIPLSSRNYFPNGTFDFVYRRTDSSEWLDSTITGQTISNGTILKTTYDYSSSSRSGGLLLQNNGTLEATIDSCYAAQKYQLTFNYKKGGTAAVEYYNSSGVLLNTASYELESSNSWTAFSQEVPMIKNVSYVKVKFAGGSETLILDNIFFTFKGLQEIEENENTNHFMSGFFGNSAALSTFSATKYSRSSKVENGTLNDADPTSTIDWRFSIAKYEYKNTDFVGSITMGSSSNTISASSDSNFSGIYNAVNSAETISGIQSVIYSTAPISNLRDVSLGWGGVEAGRVYIVYKLEEENTWNYLGTNYDATKKNNGTENASSWNEKQLVLNNSNNEFASNLFGKTAQIGFMFSSNSSNGDVSYIRLNAIIINKVNSMKAKIDYWNENSTNLCGNSGSLSDQTSLDFADLYLVNYDLSVSDANLLNTSIESVGLAREATYFDEFEYLCGIANLNVSNVPLMRHVIQIGKKEKQNVIILIAVITSCSLISALVVINIFRRKGEIH